MFNKILFTVSKNTKKNLIIAILMAIFIAGLLTGYSFLIISTDFSYFRFGPRLSGHQGFDYYTYPKAVEFDTGNIGKTTIGQGGFPFSYFTDCSIEQSGSIITPICRLSSFNEILVLLLNILVWAFFFYSLLIFVQAIRKKNNRKKTALILVGAIAILILSVFANNLISSMMKL